MAYISFDKSQIVNLEFSLSREVLRSNRAGSYSSTTIVGCNTRKYHGLLVCPVDAFGGERFVLLSSMDVSVVQKDKIFNIGIHKYKGDHFYPKGHKYIESFATMVIPEMIYRVGEVVLQQERILIHRNEQVMIRYTVLEAPEPLKLQLRPFLAFRNIHSLSHANMYADTKVEYIQNGIRMKMYEGFPWLNLQLSDPCEFVQMPDWNYAIEYPEERSRGYDYQEDLFVPGFLEVEMKEGSSIILSASTEEEKPGGFKQKFSRTMAKKVPRSNYRNCLVNSAQQFIERRPGYTDIIAGYPWFGAWGRDTFISLPGLALAREGLKLYREVLDTQVNRMKGGLFPNMGNVDNPAFNSVDAPLWFFWSLQQYRNAGGKDVATRYWNAAREIIHNYVKGEDYSIRMHENGLIQSGDGTKGLTWMDAMVHGKPVTPRDGFAVEINALWYNAVCFALEISKEKGDNEFTDSFSYLPDRIWESFNRMFWDEAKGFLADRVTIEGTKIMEVRPNMVIATSLPHIMLSNEQAIRILEVADKELVTPRGLRSLSPRNPAYVGVYYGTQEERDSAYHQGTVWPWLIGPFCEGWLRAYGKNGAEKVRKLIFGFEEVMLEHGIGSVSEIYDGDPPHAPRGAISQAWSIAEILRIINILDRNYKPQIKTSL